MLASTQGTNVSLFFILVFHVLHSMWGYKCIYIYIQKLCREIRSGIGVMRSYDPVKHF